MYLFENLNTLKIAGLVVLCVATGKADGQLAHNQYPCAECAVYDNNGNDLKGFITSNKRDLEAKGTKVNEYSANTWGYMQVRAAAVPSVNKTGERKGDRNYGETINTTFALYKTKDGAEATWWARECNSPQGPLTSRVVKEDEAEAIPTVRYETITNDLEPKAFTIVESYNNLYNARDYDVLLKNYLLVDNGTVKDPADYKSIIDFYNDFLKKFSYVDDPVLMKRSFITLLTGGSGAKYLGYFNVVNGKLAGKLVAVDFQYEQEKDTLVKKVFTKLTTGGIVYVYGDENFDLEKPIVMYARAHDIKLKRRHTNTPKKFNEDK